MRVPRVTMAQALMAFLKAQRVERDGIEQPFFAGCWGISGHGNVAGIGQALQQTPEFRYYQSRNEQAQVHAAIAYAKMKNRLQAFACTSSIGPGATNMLTGAATATINRFDQLVTALPAAMRVLTDPAETGAVTLALPQDVQTEAFDYPEGLFRERVWHIGRNRP